MYYCDIDADGKIRQGNGRRVEGWGVTASVAFSVTSVSARITVFSELTNFTLSCSAFVERTVAIFLSDATDVSAITGIAVNNEIPRHPQVKKLPNSLFICFLQWRLSYPELFSISSKL
jgi:hypothetical protein